MKNDDDIIPVSIFDIYPYPDAQQGIGSPQNFLVLLKGEADERVVPITIGHFEGQALAMAMRKVSMPRPLPHDLLRNVLQHMGARADRLVIHTLDDDVFHACLHIDAPGDALPLDCRPSDGMIIATQLAIPLFISVQVLEKAGRIIEIAESAGVGHPECDDDDVVDTVEDCAEAEDEVCPEELSEVDRLKAHLDWLIAQEAYEEAAEVRDQISKMEGQSD